MVRGNFDISIFADFTAAKIVINSVFLPTEQPNRPKNREKSKFQKFTCQFCRTISKDQSCQILDWLGHFPETSFKISDEKKSWNNGFLSYGSRFSAIFALKTHKKCVNMINVALEYKLNP